MLACEPLSLSPPDAITKLGSSLGTAIVLQPRCEPIKARLDQNAAADLKFPA
jgi:hypothetical protein